MDTNAPLANPLDAYSEQITPHLPPNSPPTLLPHACNFFAEITTRSYEEISILMGIQQLMIESLVAAISDAAKKQTADTLVKEALTKTNSNLAADIKFTDGSPSSIILPRRFNGN
jgi:hypothetical protein